MAGPVVVPLRLEAAPGDASACFSEHHVFVPGPAKAPLGARVRVEVREAGTGALLGAFEGRVVWRYREGTVPPGKVAGMGVRIDALDEQVRALLDEMRRREGAGALARPPGASLVPLELAPPRRSPSSKEQTDRSPAPPASVDDVPDLCSDDFFLAEREAEMLEAHRRGSAPSARGPAPAVRPLPPAVPPEALELPRPEIHGVAFLVAPTRSGTVVEHVEPVRWPKSGHRRRSLLDDARDAGEEAFEAALIRDPSFRRDPAAPRPADEEAEGFDDQTDPTHRVSDVVQRALQASALADEVDEPPADEKAPPSREDEPEGFFSRLKGLLLRR